MRASENVFFPGALGETQQLAIVLYKVIKVFVFKKLHDVVGFFLMFLC